MLTDERNGGRERKWLASLPKNTWVIVRAHTKTERINAFKTLKKARGNRRDLRLLISVDTALARRLGADGVHYPDRALRRAQPAVPVNMLQTTAVHCMRSKVRAEKRAAASVRLISPILATLSHSGEKTLGWFSARKLIAPSNTPHYAMGGMLANSLNKAIGYGFYGVAGVALWRILCVSK